MFSDMLQNGIKVLGAVSNGVAKASGGTPGYTPPDGTDQGDGTFPQAIGSGLMGLLNRYRANKTQTSAGAQGPSLAQGGGIGAPQPGAQAGTLFGSMGPARSSLPQY